MLHEISDEEILTACLMVPTYSSSCFVFAAYFFYLCTYMYIQIPGRVVRAMSLLMGIGDCALLAFGENNGCCFVALLDM